jgi:hypothetical protein
MRRPTHRSYVHRHPVVTAVLCAGLTAACGPTTSVAIDIRPAPVNIKFGGPAKTPARPLDIDRTGNGFIAPAVPLDPIAPVTPEGPLTPSGPLGGRPAEPPCPIAPGNTPAEEAAPTTVSAPPHAGVYRFRRSGFLQAAKPGDPEAVLPSQPIVPLSSTVTREVSNVQTTEIPGNPVGSPRITFDVVQNEPGLRTTTSYLVDPVGAYVGEPVDVGVAHAPQSTTPGLKITQIKLERSDLPADGPGGSGAGAGTETFAPQPPIRIFTLPAGGETPPPVGVYSDGTDPTTGATMRVYAATVGRVPVDVCGRVIQGWKVQLSFPNDGTGPRDSTYDRQLVRSYTVRGSFVFAPQFCQIVQDDLTFTGLDVGARPYRLSSSTTISSLRPS